MIAALALLLAGQAVASTNQTGGITANRVDNVVQVWSGTAPSTAIFVPPRPFMSVACLVRRRLFVFNHGGTLDRTPRFRAMSADAKRRALAPCMVVGRE